MLKGTWNNICKNIITLKQDKSEKKLINEITRPVHTLNQIRILNS